MSRRARPLSDRLLLLALAQQGVFSRQDAVRLGHHDMDLHSWVRGGEIVSATRGGYYLSPERWPHWRDLSVPQQNLAHERLRILAVLHVLPAAFVASYGSALVLHGLPRKSLPSARAEVHVMALQPVKTVPRRPSVRVHAPIPATGTSSVRAVPVEDAIAQEGCRDGLVGALIPADAALADGRLDLRMLGEACRRLAGRPGATGLDAVVALADRRSEAPGESWTRLICASAGISVTPQVWIHDARGRFARVDLLLDDTRVIIEFDGLGKYADPEEARREKLREQRLHRAGYVVVRVTWDDFADIPALVARIRVAIERAALLAY